MGEKVVIHAACPLSRKHMLVTAARAKQLKERGDEVLLTYCAAGAGVCMVNHTANPVLCQLCHSTVRGTARSAGLPVVPLHTPRDSVDDQPLPSERRQLMEGVFSDLISRFRLLKPDLRRNVLLRAIKRRSYATALGRLRAFTRVIGPEPPDRIEVFNGRQACSKFPLIAAERLGVPITTLEMNGAKEPVVYEGHTAHDRVGIQRRIMRCDADFEKAEAYYQRRRSPRFSRHSKQLQGGFTPPETGRFRRKVSFFLSSQDEFESLGRDWRSEFDDYAGVIRAACERYPDTFFAIRFHPNQGKINSDITSPFAAVKALDNTRLYLPDCGVDTYQLIEWSDVVVTFGSTVTAEACWARRPTVLLGPSFFDRLEIAHTPKDTREFLDLLAGDVSLSDRTNAARVATYFQDSCDPLPHLHCEGGRVAPIGFRRAWPLLTGLSRPIERLACLVVKKLARRAVAKKTPVAVETLKVEPSPVQRKAA